MKLLLGLPLLLVGAARRAEVATGRIAPDALSRAGIDLSTCKSMANKSIVNLHTGKTAGNTITLTFEELNLSFTAVHFYAGRPQHGTPDIPSQAMTSLALADYDVYIVPTRNPVSRVISAFNALHTPDGAAWLNPASPFVPISNATVDGIISNAMNVTIEAELDAKQHHYALLQALSTCFPQLPGGVNAFAEALAGPPGGCNDVARRALLDTKAGTVHLSQGYSFMLGLTNGSTTVLEKMRQKGKRVFHVAQENFDADFAAMWRWLCMETPVTVVDHAEDLPLPQCLRHDDVNITAAGRAALEAYLADEYHALAVLSTFTENKNSSTVDGSTRSSVDLHR